MIMENFSLNRIESFSMSTAKGIIKGTAIWGEIGSATFPLCYLHKPKWMSEGDFNKFLNALVLKIDKELLK